jgi:DNA-binding CsgD family transcriptional regulator
MSLTASLLSKAKKEKTQITRLKHLLIDEYRVAALEDHPLWKDANVGPLVLSLRPLSSTKFDVIALYRPFNHSKFTHRESRIAHIVLTEVLWRHGTDSDETVATTVKKLSNRERLTLNHLIAGRNRKQIAEEMNVSPHTLHGYIKRIYSHFKIHSQFELMKSFYEGNGHDRS